MKPTEKRFRCSRRAAACLLALLLLAGCKDSGEEPTDSPETPSPTASPSPAVSESVAPTQEQPTESPSVPPETETVNPLTGEPMDEMRTKSRPVAIMLNNITAALPQQGNCGADIIYEAVAEGGITRMLGIYQSVNSVGVIGSVRSARPYFIELAQGHDAVFVHAGGSEDAYADLEAWSVDHMDGVNGTYSKTGMFWRNPQRIAGKNFAVEHSLVTSGDEVWNALAGSGFRLTHSDGWSSAQLFADDGTPEGGTNAKSVVVSHFGGKATLFRYDLATGLYRVEQYGEAYIDGDSGEQVAVTNVLVLRVQMADTQDDYNHMELKLTNGDGWYACGGKVIPIVWEKGEHDQPLTYRTQTGDPLVLGRGKSYVNLVPQTADITCS